MISTNFRDLSSRWDLRFIIILLIYIALGLILLKYYQFQINSDGMGYIQRAEFYINGNLDMAIDAYWGPLLSWLLVPFLYFSQSPLYELLSVKILSLMVGFITLIGIRFLSYRFSMNEVIRTVILVSSIPIIIYFAFSIITPDLLMVCALVYYFYFIFDPNYSENKYKAVFCGITGSLAFFAKSFAFPFFLAHFSLFNLFHYTALDKNKRKNIVKSFLIGLTTFLLISGVWVGIISDKEDNITFGTSGSFNHALVGPNSEGFPQYYQGFIKPGVKNSIDLKPWSPFASLSNFKYQLKIVWENIQKEMNYFLQFSYFSLAIILFYFLLCFKPLQKLVKSRQILYPLSTILIFSAIYLPVLVEDRYLWPAYILLLLMGGFLVNKLFESEIFSKTAKILLLLFLAVSFVVMPVTFLFNNINTDKDLYDLSFDLKNQYHINGSYASNDQLMQMSLMSFYIEQPYYGQAKKGETDEELQKDFDELELDYYFVWGDSNPNKKLLSQYKEVTGGGINGLQIYSIQNI